MKLIVEELENNLYVELKNMKPFFLNLRKDVRFNSVANIILNNAPFVNSKDLFKNLACSLADEIKSQLECTIQRKSPEIIIYNTINDIIYQLLCICKNKPYNKDRQVFLSLAKEHRIYVQLHNLIEEEKRKISQMKKSNNYNNHFNLYLEDHTNEIIHKLFTNLIAKRLIEKDSSEESFFYYLTGDNKPKNLKKINWIKHKYLLYTFTKIISDKEDYNFWDIAKKCFTYQGNEITSRSKDNGGNAEKIEALEKIIYECIPSLKKKLAA